MNRQSMRGTLLLKYHATSKEGTNYYGVQENDLSEGEISRIQGGHNHK
jgi:hypothetical protein